MTSFRLIPVVIPQGTQRVVTGGVMIALTAVLVIESADGGNWRAMPGNGRIMIVQNADRLAPDHLPEPAVEFVPLIATSTPVTASAFVSADTNADHAAYLRAYWSWVSAGVTPSVETLSRMLVVFAPESIKEKPQETTPQTGPSNAPSGSGPGAS